MKSILYVGATLMIGASIYGFVDYKKNNHKKEFTRMYEMEKKESLPARKEEVKIKKEAVVKEDIIDEKEDVNVSQAEDKILNSAKASKKKLNYKLFSRAPLERKYLNKEIKIEEPKTVVEPDKSVQKNSPNEKKEQ